MTKYMLAPITYSTYVYRPLDITKFLPFEAWPVMSVMFKMMEHMRKIIPAATEHPFQG
jgi:hypothetical protein